jgi:exodeoxyribonuclease-3
MKIATFNVNSIGSRLPNLLEWLEREKPDVACLQELKAPDNRFPQMALAQAGYGAIWHGQTSYNGVAILTKGSAAKETQRGLAGDPNDTHSRYIEGEFGGVTVACLYLPNGNPQPGPKFEYKLSWFERLIERAAELFQSKQPVVVCGDFNVVPTDFDIYDPKNWRKDALLQPASRDAYARLLKQGWVDAIRHLHPEKRIYTFWDYFRNHYARDAGLRIDHLLLNAPAARRLEAAGVDKWVRGQAHASDHAPAWVTLS